MRQDLTLLQTDNLGLYYPLKIVKKNSTGLVLCDQDSNEIFVYIENSFGFVANYALKKI